MMSGIKYKIETFDEKKRILISESVLLKIL